MLEQKAVPIAVCNQQSMTNFTGQCAMHGLVCTNELLPEDLYKRNLLSRDAQFATQMLHLSADGASCERLASDCACGTMASAP